MSKTIKMAIRAEPELRDAFNKAAAKVHRPAADILRELMRKFVQEQKAKK